MGRKSSIKKIIKVEKEKENFSIYDITVNNRYKGTLKIMSVKPEIVDREISAKVSTLGISPGTNYKKMKFPFIEDEYLLKEKNRLIDLINGIPEKRSNVLKDSRNLNEYIREEFKILMEDEKLIEFLSDLEKSYSSIEESMKEFEEILKTFEDRNDKILDELNKFLKKLSKVTLEELDELDSNISKFYVNELTEISNISAKSSTLKNDASKFKSKINSLIESKARKKALKKKRAKEAKDMGLTNYVEKEEED